MTDWLCCKWGFVFCFTNREETEGILLFVLELSFKLEQKPSLSTLNKHCLSPSTSVGLAFWVRKWWQDIVAFEDPGLQLIEWLWVICWLAVITLTKARARVTYGRKTICSGLPKTKFSTQTRFMCPGTEGRD